MDGELITRQDLPDIIKRYADGESLQTIAGDAKVSRRTLYRWMLAGIGDDQYRAQVTDCLVARIADADQALETAQDACHIARAREAAKFARMDLERRRPGLYGQKQQIELTVSDLGDRIRLARERVAAQQTGEKIIEGEIVKE